MARLTIFSIISVIVLCSCVAKARLNMALPTNKSFSFEIVPGIFVQDDPATIPSEAGPIPPRFGLIDESTDRWRKLKEKIGVLNREASRGTIYKLLFLARHGQGYHNVAESQYGTAAWDDYWSKLNGDGTLVWGPDAKLTSVGIQQAETANQAWKTELPFGIPLPQQLYSSPLSRAASTANITFRDISIDRFPFERPLILEHLREILGVHTCDKRDTRTYLRKTYPRFVIEPGFTEEDELWLPDVRETNEEQDIRIRGVLNRIFAQDRSTYISITAHGGVINSVFRNIGHQVYGVPTGGVVPILIKATVN